MKTVKFSVTFLRKNRYETLTGKIKYDERKTTDVSAIGHYLAGYCANRPSLDIVSVETL